MNYQQARKEMLRLKNMSDDDLMTLKILEEDKKKNEIQPEEPTDEDVDEEEDEDVPT